jgi:WXXGXW repeat (2 copies)
MKTCYSPWKIAILVAIFAALFAGSVFTQEPLPPAPVPAASGAQSQPTYSPGTPLANPPQTQNGIDVLARGPIHEAFATPTTEPTPTTPVDKPPPKPIEELPPAERPEGNVTWIPGYWVWDDERKDYLWVSGTWRAPPPGKHWVTGYWKGETGQWRWVPGFWTVAQNQANHSITYLPAPPASPNAPVPGNPPTPDSFYVPGQWAWHDAGTVVINGTQTYREAGYAWTAGYWARVQPGYVWVADHYRWTPSGYIYIPGYWDLALARRGFLYAPVYVNAAIVGPGFVYTPTYAVPHTVLIDALWVRPCYCHYYFGDYYGAVYTRYGFENCVIYGRRAYDPIFVYAVYEHRAEPRWASMQMDICIGRAAGRIPCPPHTLVEQVRIGYRGPGLVASARVGELYGVRTVRLEQRERSEAVRHAEEIRHVAIERNLHEIRPVGGVLTAPKAAAYRIPPAPSGLRPIMVPPPRSIITSNTKKPVQKKPDPHDR